MPKSLSTPLRGGALGSNLSIRTKGLILIAIPVLCQLVVLGLLRQVQNHGAEAERWAVHSKNVIAAGDALYLTIVQAVASQRAAVIAENADFEQGLSPEPGAISRQLESLVSLVRDNTIQAERIRALREDGVALEAWIGSQRALVRTGRAEEAASRISASEGRDRMERISALMAAFLADERRLDEERLARLRTVSERGRMMTTLAAGVSLLLAALFAYVFSRSVSARLAVVTTNAGRLAAGEPLAAPVAGSDEIAQLDAVLHDSSRRLAESAAETGRAHAEMVRRADELSVVNHELGQQTQENELFIYSVSHDLRSPLVNLQGFSKELDRSCDELRKVLDDEPSLPAPVRARVATLTGQDIPESIHFIRTAVTRASAIIDALLRLSRVGRVEYQWQAVDIGRTLTTIMDAMRATINERRAAIVVHPLEPAWGDPTAVEQVFANLVGNAVNYLDPARAGRIEIGMVTPAAAAGADADADADADAAVPDGAGAVSGHGASAAGNAAIAVTGDAPASASGSLPASDDGFFTYYIRDNGLGIPAPSVDKVFVAFQRLHPRAARGEGIGLAVVRRIVERHRGRIWGRIGPGGRIDILRDAAARRRRRGCAGGASPGRIGASVVAETVSIIVVEDDDGHATLIERNLRRAGLDNPVIRLHDGQEALDFFFGAGTGQPVQPSDVVLLLDINMPKVDGIDVLRQLKADPRTAMVPSIILTTTDDPREIERCYALGCNVYITKPVEYEAFIEAIRRLGFFLQIVKIPSNGARRA